MPRVAALAAALGLAGVAAVATSGDGKLVFSDDFDGSRVDPERWRTCHWWSHRGCTIASNDELEWYLPRQARVAGGQLRLLAERRRVRGVDGEVYPYRSGMISSGPGPESPPRFAFTYGRAEIRALVPAGRGLWPAFWLLPADRESKPEIDVFEIYGQSRDTVRMRLHPRRGERVGREWSGLRPGWHTFAVDWRPGRLAWLVDGVQRWRVRGDDVPSEPMYLIANLAVGGAGAGDPDPKTRFPASLAIDWVRVWK